MRTLFLRSKEEMALELARAGLVLTSPVFMFDFGKVILSSGKQT